MDDFLYLAIPGVSARCRLGRVRVRGRQGAEARRGYEGKGGYQAGGGEQARGRIKAFDQFVPTRGHVNSPDASLPNNSCRLPDSASLLHRCHAAMREQDLLIVIPSMRYIHCWCYWSRATQERGRERRSARSGKRRREWDWDEIVSGQTTNDGNCTWMRGPGNVAHEGD